MGPFGSGGEARALGDAPVVGGMGRRAFRPAGKESLEEPGMVVFDAQRFDVRIRDAHREARFTAAMGTKPDAREQAMARAREVRHAGGAVVRHRAETEAAK